MNEQITKDLANIKKVLDLAMTKGLFGNLDSAEAIIDSYANIKDFINYHNKPNGGQTN